VIDIRPANRRDVPLILRLVRELAEFEREPDAVVATEDMLSDALFSDRPAAEAIIADSGGEPAGFALFFQNFSTFLGKRGLYLEDLYVRPSMRGSGLGTLMLKKLAALAVERQCGRFEWSVLDWNQNAIDFYEKMGATVLPDWRIVRVTGEPLERLAQ